MKPDRKNNPNLHRPGSAKAAVPKVSEDSEPVADSSPLPTWIFPLLAVLLLWGQLYLDRNGGGFRAEVYEPYNSYAAVVADNPKIDGGLSDKGRLIYTANCAVCHQPSGLGTPGQFPPLVGSEWVTAEGANRLIRIPIHGLAGNITIKGEKWNAAMPAIGATLSDEEIASVLTYIRQEWGNKAGPVTPAQVKKVRGEVAGRTEPWSETELNALPEAIP